MSKQNLVTNYQIFFDLRNKYPEHCSLIGEMMEYYFNNKDSFSNVDYLYLKKNYSPDEIKLIFGELNLPFKDILSSPNRLNTVSLVRLKN